MKIWITTIFSLIIILLAACEDTSSTKDPNVANVLFREIFSEAFKRAAATADVEIFLNGLAVSSRNDALVAAVPTQGNTSMDIFTYIKLPQQSACADILPLGFYLLEVLRGKTTAEKAVARLRNSNGHIVLKDIPIAIEQLKSPPPEQPTVSTFINPMQAQFGRWSKCSDGLGHCGNAITIVPNSRTCI